MKMLTLKKMKLLISLTLIGCNAYKMPRMALCVLFVTQVGIAVSGNAGIHEDAKLGHGTRPKTFAT